MEELQKELIKHLGALGALLGFVLGVLGIASQFVKIWLDKRKSEQTLRSLRPPPAPSTPQASLPGLSPLHLAYGDRSPMQWRIDDLEHRLDSLGQAKRELERDNDRTREALVRERSDREHLAHRLRLAQREIEHLRTIALEYEERLRVMDSGFTRLGPSPFAPEPPTRVVEVDERPTLPPRGERPWWRR